MTDDMTWCKEFDILRGCPNSTLWHSGIQTDEMDKIEEQARPLVLYLRSIKAKNINIVITTRGIDVKFEDTIHVNI